jgi:hypothetical protein
MLSFLVSLLIIVVVCGFLWWILSLLPLGQPWGRVAQVLVALIALFWFLSALGLFGHPWRAHLGG